MESKINLSLSAPFSDSDTLAALHRKSYFILIKEIDFVSRREDHRHRRLEDHHHRYSGLPVERKQTSLNKNPGTHFLNKRVNRDRTSI